MINSATLDNRKERGCPVYKCYAGEWVKGGYYWSFKTKGIITIPKEGGTLPGPKGFIYWHLNVLEMLSAALMLGALYVLSLPTIVWVYCIVTLANFFGQKIAAAVVWRVCRSGNRSCHGIHRFLWGQCGKTFTDDPHETIRMITLALIVATYIFFWGWVIVRYHVFN